MRTFNEVLAFVLMCIVVAVLLVVCLHYFSCSSGAGQIPVAVIFHRQFDSSFMVDGLKQFFFVSCRDLWQCGRVVTATSCPAADFFEIVKSFTCLVKLAACLGHIEQDVGISENDHVSRKVILIAFFSAVGEWYIFLL